MRMFPGSTALLRHDKYPETPPYPRGGVLVPQAVIDAVIGYFFSLGRIVALYEPANPLCNFHNLNVLFESTSRATVEIVGPGFDASDLQRGDLSPHEVCSVSLSQQGFPIEVRLEQRVSDGEYRASVLLRKQKIAAKLTSAPSPDLALLIRKNLNISEDLEDYLLKVQSPLCDSSEYSPVPRELLKKTLIRIAESGAIERFIRATNVGFPLVVSTSLVNRGAKQVFWDIVSPVLKYAEITS